MYKCGYCKKIIEIQQGDNIRCPFCGYKILYKTRSGAVKTVKAR